MSDFGRARDIELLDAIDAFRREQFTAKVWRVVREGRDPAQGNPSRSRWCNGTFDVLYTALERDGAIAEVHAFLAMQPVFPSKLAWKAHSLAVEIDDTLKLADLPTLARLGVDTSHYQDRNYARTQEIADGAYFLGFDGLVAPSARWSCLNLMIFSERVDPDRIELAASSETAIDWSDWRKRNRR